MAEALDYKRLYEQEQKKVSVLEQKLALFEDEPEKSGYFALKRILNAQIKILNKFDLDTEIGQNPKDDKKYDRTKSLWEGLKPMIVELKNLKVELGITSLEEEKESKKTIKSFSPEAIADAIGESAGKKN